MPVNSEDLRFILGLKLKGLRQERGYSLTEAADRAGLSVSYLSEIEKGRKYPKPDKLIKLAGALDVPYDELVSLQVGDELETVKSVFSSTFVHEFPFELFGVKPEDVFGVIAEQPGKAAALIRTVLEIGQMYDVQVEHFLFAALRSYQQMHRNYFEDLETAAAEYRAEAGWPAGEPPGEARMRTALEAYGYEIDEETLPEHPNLRGFRSVLLEGDPPKLLVNGRLMPSQRAFIYGREIGYLHLGLEERALTGSWLEIDSFDQVLNNFKASYFAGALMIDREALVADLKTFFGRPAWSDEAFLGLMKRYEATPEMFFYRLSQLASKFFGLDEVYFMRFHNRAGSDAFRLTKVLNMSRVPVPHGIGLSEHYCRRWPAMKLLRELASQQRSGGVEDPLVRAQRSRFIDEDAEFFVVSMSRPLSLTEGTNSCVSLGFLMNDAFRKRVRFWDDPGIARVDVNLTCERCPLSAEACHDRVAPPTIYERDRRRDRQDRALAELMEARQMETVAEA